MPKRSRIVNKVNKDKVSFSNYTSQFTFPIRFKLLNSLYEKFILLRIYGVKFLFNK